MIDYVVGKLAYKDNDYIVIESSNIGYKIIVSNVNDYIIDKEYKVFLYLHLHNEEFNLYGFNSINKRNIFIKIINVKGIGPKTAINMFKNINEEEIIRAINDENINLLKSLPNIGLKSAKQIILDLKGKLANDNNYSNELINVKNALKNLGFKAIDIDNVIKQLVKEKLSTEEYLKKALIMLNKSR